MSSSSPSSETPTAVLEQIAQQVFGYEKLRPAQLEVLESVLSGRDTLAVMPTGSGKSAIYQIAALRLKGVTVVISPLIALQQDQVDAITAQDTVKAAVLNSTLNKTERAAVFEKLANEELEFLFLAPEQFSNEETRSRLETIRPSLFVVDEAHCVSEWGHDFRPDYLQLGGVIESLGHPVVLALTATASPLVRQEILERLEMRDPVEIVQGFDRPNLHLSAYSFHEEAAKRKALLDAIAESTPPGIVYVATRKAAKELSESLIAQEINAAAYHAGLSSKERDDIQDRFMADEINVIVATNAFGMGIDKPNVRFVYHYHIPGSIDAYYQEIGRAGRDGEPADIKLFYRPDDMKLQRFFASGGSVDEETLSDLAQLIEAAPDMLTEEQLLEHGDLSQAKLATALEKLEAVDLIERGAKGEISAIATDIKSAIDQAMTQQERRHQFDQSRLKMISGYAETQSCRRAYILSYFGEPFEPPCGKCDRCEAPEPLEPANDSFQPFPISSTIIHTNFGKGQVLRYEDDKVCVLFETVGYKTFVTEMIADSVRCLDT